VFVDQVEITVQSGNGGKGCVSFRREKYVPKGGPDGGNGGRGGDVVLVANAQLHTLLDQRYKRHYEAEHGSPGMTSNKKGKSGEHLVVSVPCGTIVRNADTSEILADLTTHGQSMRVVRGGLGGRGNAEFATSTNRAPRKFEPGLPGQSRRLMLELKLIADIGLVGYPNAGKSTLISRISAAQPKIADYPFTTLEPNLGIVRYRDFDAFTVADLPGLIEGAHKGKGLGSRFLKHIERTRVLAILIECISENLFADLAILRNELLQYGSVLAGKQWMIAVSKMDLANEEIREKVMLFAYSLRIRVVPFSSVSGEAVNELLDAMWSLIEKQRREEVDSEDSSERYWSP